MCAIENALRDSVRSTMPLFVPTLAEQIMVQGIVNKQKVAGIGTLRVGHNG